MTDYSFIFNAHPSYIDALYQQYKADPAAMDSDWRLFFEGFDFGETHHNGKAAAPGDTASILAELRVLSLIKGYRDRGHLESTTNPIKPRRDRHANLQYADFNLTEADLDRTFVAGKELGLENATLRDIIAHLRKIYCGNIGLEYHHIQDREKRRWLRDKFEKRMLNDMPFSKEQKHRILDKLNGAEVLETFLHTKFIGQKRFSLEGGETTIPALDAIINKGAADKVEEVVIGMAHRGRLNVLVNIMGKTYEQIFTEFQNINPTMSFGDGDVKYHLGYSSIVKTDLGKEVHLKLVPNPSHLEAVDTVVEGFARAKADILYDSEYDRILPILIHGDAALAGQGVVYEAIQMSQLKGYDTGGTVHFVTNNQIGFTTDFDDARSSTYCTGVAAVVQAPVFHVNGDDPEAVVFASELAVEYRQKFNDDVFIDMVCYRRHGHNEGDDPQFTQPTMYDLIKNHPNPREIYLRRLVERGEISREEGEQLEKALHAELQARLDMVKQKPLPYTYQEPEQAWRKLKKQANDPADFFPSPETGIASNTMQAILAHLMSVPEGFKPLSKMQRLFKGKQKLMDDKLLDWGMAELLAYGSLLVDGHDVRMSGQDCKRGTFSHRHAVLYDAETNEQYNRLDGIAENQGKFRIYNSLLSEFGVLGFEYGYSMSTPDALVVWEGQFGDFSNGAQTIIDQFISAGESKWQRMNGITMLLPHGYEGQGPEHSSARLERYLQLCADFNMAVCNITNPANFFHALRRQLARPFRKPLIVMSPKSLLRHERCVASFDEFSLGTRFQEVYDDAACDSAAKAKKVQRVICCSGKVYYDLLDYKERNDRKDVAIVRIEQLYPFPKEEVGQLLQKKYKGAEVIWAQEEPANMGAWSYINTFHQDVAATPFRLVSRKPSASPATGFKTVHDQQQAGLVDAAFN
jgi:2-oxoglutarate dehydrogenase E1 component